MGGVWAYGSVCLATCDWGMGVGAGVTAKQQDDEHGSHGCDAVADMEGVALGRNTTCPCRHNVVGREDAMGW